MKKEEKLIGNERIVEIRVRFDKYIYIYKKIK